MCNEHFDSLLFSLLVPLIYGATQVQLAHSFVAPQSRYRQSVSELARRPLKHILLQLTGFDVTLLELRFQVKLDTKPTAVNM